MTNRIRFLFTPLDASFRPFRLWLLVLLVVQAFCLFLRAPAIAAPQLTPSQQSILNKANRHEKEGWIYLHIEGTPQERGFQHGFHLAQEIAEGIRVTSIDWEYESAMKWSWLVEKASAMFLRKIDEENLAEIDAIVDGMRIAGVSSTRDELVAYNAYLELLGYWWP